MRELGHGGEYILSPSHALEGGALENLLALIDETSLT